MINSKRTLKDLSFTGNDIHNVWNLIDKCETFVGRKVLQKLLNYPPNSYEELVKQQAVIRFWAENPEYWSGQITNGTIVMLEKFYESADSYASHPGGFNFLSGKLFQKIFNRNEFHFTQFSVSHLSDFLKGCLEFVSIANKTKDIPEKLLLLLSQMDENLQHRLVPELCKIDKNTPFKTIAQLSFHARREMKVQIGKLTDAYAKLDAWRGLAQATIANAWIFPTISTSEELHYDARELYHPLLSKPVNYNIRFSKEKNFMLLTGANMSGKTTLMRTLGIGAILAHLGMGVPAKEMTISFLEGVITNMHVEDNIHTGESFFFAEVKSIKETAQQLSDNGAHLVLMDELFKGTNVHDAFECTKAIIAGLLEHPQHIFVLSTHLHEVAHYFEKEKGISFYKFSTDTDNEGNFHFSYQLEPGISDEKIGYKILVKEGIIDILKKRRH